MGGIGIADQKGIFPKGSTFLPLSLSLSLLRDIFGRLCALHPLIRKKSSRRGSPLMVVPRCHGYLHASNKRWLRGSRLLLPLRGGKKRKRVAKFSFPLAAFLRDSVSPPLLLLLLLALHHSFSLSPFPRALDNGFEVCVARIQDAWIKERNSGGKKGITGTGVFFFFSLFSFFFLLRWKWYVLAKWWTLQGPRIFAR